MQLSLSTITREKVRAWETAWRQASTIAKREGGQSNVNLVKDCESKKTSSGFGTHKCYVCGKKNK